MPRIMEMIPIIRIGRPPLIRRYIPAKAAKKNERRNPLFTDSGFIIPFCVTLTGPSLFSESIP